MSGANDGDPVITLSGIRKAISKGGVNMSEDVTTQSTESELESYETTDEQHTMVSDTESVSEVTTSLTDTDTETESVTESGTNTEKEDAVTDLESHYTIDDVMSAQSVLIEESQKQTQGVGGLLLCAIIFISVSFAWALGKWFYNIVRC